MSAPRFGTKLGVAPISALIQSGRWIYTEIFSVYRPGERAHVVRKLLKVAGACLRLHNFDVGKLVVDERLTF